MENTIKPTVHDSNYYRTNEVLLPSYAKDVSSNFNNLYYFQSLTDHKPIGTKAGIFCLYKEPHSGNTTNQTDLIPQRNNENMKKIQNVPFSKEWTNSNYTFGKNNSKLLPVTDKIINQLIKSYFNLSLLKKNKRSKRIEILFKRLSPNKLFVSKAEIKHTNDKVIVTAYVYNRKDKFLSFKMKSLHIAPSRSHPIGTKLKKGKKYHSEKHDNIYIPRLKPNRREIYLESYNSEYSDFTTNLQKASKPVFAQLNKPRRKNDFFIKYKYIVSKSTTLLRKIGNSKRLLLKYLNWDIDNFRDYEIRYYRDFLKKAYKNLVLDARYRKLSFFDHKKFSNWFLIGIKSLLSKIYKKNVELNIVNLKYLPFNNDNFMEAVSDKLKNRNNKLVKVLRKAMEMVNIPSINLYTQSTYLTPQGKGKIGGIKVHNSNLVTLPVFHGRDLRNMKTKHLAHKNMTNYILRKGKYSVISGVRLEAAGRLSKRLTASRSVFKYKYKGSLRNIESLYGNISYALYRGYIKPNVRYTSLSSKTRNGAFGLKGWISSY